MLSTKLSSNRAVCGEAVIGGGSVVVLVLSLGSFCNMDISQIPLSPPAGDSSDFTTGKTSSFVELTVNSLNVLLL